MLDIPPPFWNKMNKGNYPRWLICLLGAESQNHPSQNPTVMAGISIWWLVLD